MGLVNEELAEEITGAKKPKEFLVLDSSALDMAETHRIIREDIRRNRIRYYFPAGFNKIDLYEECRALQVISDDTSDGDVVFKVMYDVTMQLLVNKDVRITMLDGAGNEEELCLFHVTDRYQDLRGAVEAIDKWPTLVTWMTEFVAEYLIKKYPQPGKIPSDSKAAEKSRAKKAGGKQTSGKDR